MNIVVTNAMADLMIVVGFIFALCFSEGGQRLFLLLPDSAPRIEPALVDFTLTHVISHHETKLPHCSIF